MFTRLALVGLGELELQVGVGEERVSLREFVGGKWVSRTDGFASNPALGTAVSRGGITTAMASSWAVIV